jgi:hypothetical protein
VYYLHKDDKKLTAIPCSCRDLSIFGADGKDLGWIIYPGYKIQLFYHENYGDISSQIVPNNSEKPIFAKNANWTNIVNAAAAEQIYQYNLTSNFFLNNSTSSIKIWYNDVELTISGLS